MFYSFVLCMDPQTSAICPYSPPLPPHDALPIFPDLVGRAGIRQPIVRRTIRTWGERESSIAELLAPRLDALDALGNPTIAFLASGIEGLKVRITARADSEAAAGELLDAEEAEIRAILAELVFSSADETRSEEHTSELQSLMPISYAVFCLKKKKHIYADKNTL